MTRHLGIRRLCMLTMAVATIARGDAVLGIPATPIVFYDASTIPEATTELASGAAVIDLSGASNNGNVQQAVLPLIADTPTGVGRSFDFRAATSGTIRTNAFSLLHNSVVAAAGGFQMDAWIKLESDSSGPFGSVINYAGTERMQLAGQTGGPGGLNDESKLEFRVNNYFVANPDVVVVDNAWHHVISKFIVTDASDPLNLVGDIHLVIDNQTVIFQQAVKTSQGDDLIRPIGIGNHPTSGNNSNDDFDGLIFQPKVSIGYDVDATQRAFKLLVNRTTGGVTLQNIGPSADIVGYQLLSPRGMLKTSAAWLSIADTADFDSGMSFDPDDTWIHFERTVHGLGESTLGEQTMATNATRFVGNVVETNPFTDVSAEVLLSDGSVLYGYVEYSGPTPKLGDFNFDGSVDEADFAELNANLFSQHIGLTGYEQYLRGDMDGDGDTDENDFVAFKTEYLADAAAEAAGVGSNAAVPEPVAWGLVLIGVALLWLGRSKPRRYNWAIASAVLAVASLPFPATAAVTPVFFYDATDAGAGPLVAGVTAINDLSGAGHHGNVKHFNVATTTDVPAGFTGRSFNFIGTAGQITTNAAQLINNTDIAASGGFIMEAWFKNDMVPASATGKIIDYGGFERIQFAGSASGVGAINNKKRVEFRTSNTVHRVGGARGPDVDDIQWHYVVAEFVVTNGSNLADLVGDMRISIDGSTEFKLNGGKSNAGDNAGGGTPTSTISMGNRPTVTMAGAAGSGDNLEGLVFQPKVWLGTVEEPLKLRVNATTGAVTMRYVNDTVIPGLTTRGRDIDFYKIASAGESLTTGGWNSLDEQGFDAGGAAVGDFDLDGDADGADFLNWQRTLGATVPIGTGADGNQNTLIDGGDLTIWKNNFGASAGAAWVEAGIVSSTEVGESFLTGSSLFNGTMSVGLGNLFDTTKPQDLVFTYHVAGEAVFRQGVVEYVTGAATAVPEPSAWALGASMAIAIAFRCLGSVRRRLIAGFSCLLALAALGAPAASAKHVDRDYKLGESDNTSGTPADGLIVGSTTLSGRTFDDTAPFFDMSQSGNPVYRNVSGRPMAGGSTLGVEFDGVDDYLLAPRLGLPSTSVSASSGTDLVNITNRGFQFWANPDDGKLALNQLQSVVVDTNRHGVLISAAGTWVMRYNNVDVDTGVAVKLNAADGGWSHVMVVRPFGDNGGAFGGGSRMYVDGVAVAFRGGGYTGTDDSPLVVGSNTAGTFAAFTGGSQDFFQGVIDDLELFVTGKTSSTPPVDYGQFNLAADNEFIANTLAGRTPGDLTGDNVVDGTGVGGPNDDVAAFVSNWRAERIVNDAVVPDLVSYNMGDFNLDGRVNFIDWGILRANHVNGGSLDLAAILNGAVPEPSSIALTIAALVVFAKTRRSRGAVG